MYINSKEPHTLAILVFCCFLLSSSCTREAAKSRLCFAEDTVYIDTVEVGYQKPFEIILSNIGSQDLIIDAVSAGCDCTEVKIASNHVPAGKSTVVKGIFHAIGSLEDKQHRNFETVIVVKSNSKNIFDSIHIKGVVKDIF